MAIREEMLDELLGAARTQEDLFGKDGLLKQLSKRFMGKPLRIPPHSFLRAPALKFEQ